MSQRVRVGDEWSEKGPRRGIETRAGFLVLLTHCSGESCRADPSLTFLAASCGCCKASCRAELEGSISEHFILLPLPGSVVS